MILPVNIGVVAKKLLSSSMKIPSGQQPAKRKRLISFVDEEETGQGGRYVFNRAITNKQLHLAILFVVYKSVYWRSNKRRNCSTKF